MLLDDLLSKLHSPEKKISKNIHKTFFVDNPAFMKSLVARKKPGITCAHQIS